MIAFNDDPELQDKFIAGLEAHYAADDIAQGFYAEYSYKYSVPRFRGCAIGCMAHTMGCRPDNHRQLADAIGVPEGLLRSVDGIHEGLSPADSKEWPLQFGRSVRLGDPDLEKKLDMMVLALMVDPVIGVLQYAANEESKAAIQGVVTLYRRKIAGDSISRSEWTAARLDANAVAYTDDAATNTAVALAYSAAADDTYAAAYAATAAAYAATATATAASSVAYAAYNVASANAIYDDTDEVVNAVLDARLSALNAYDAAKDTLDRVKEAYWHKVRDHLLNLLSTV